MNRELWLQRFGGENAQTAPEAAEDTAAAPEAGAEDTETQTGETAPAVIQDPPPEGKPAADGEQRARLLGSVSAALEERKNGEEIRRITQAWEKEAEEMKALYPGFDLRREIRENSGFASLLQAGVGVRRAWEAANLEAILGEAMRYAAVTAGKKTAQGVLRQAGRVQENSVLDRASSLSHRDVNSLTGPDILKILDAVSRGATIKF
jgi:hypothetical protein